MIDYVNSELFKKGGVRKDLLLQFDDTVISNDRIYQESFELTESLCSQSELKFGSCEASVMKVKIRNEFGLLKDKWLTVSMVLNNDTDNPFQFGKYKVDACELSGDKQYVNITAYDSMYDIINADVVTWYDALEFPLTMKAFRDSFFEHFGIIQEETELVQDSVIIEKTIDADEISGLKVISAICELNGVFGHINRSGAFQYVTLKTVNGYLYPSVDLFPDENLFSIGTNEIEKTRYQTCTFEEFETDLITRVHIRQEENDIGGAFGETTDNVYAVEDNFLVYGKDTEQLNVIAERLYNEIVDVYYRPFNATMRGNPCVEVGDDLIIHTKTGTEVYGYVLERTIKGIQTLKDTFEAKGTKVYAIKGNSIQKEIRQLKGKSNVLERNVEETKSTIKDVETGLSAEIVQNTQTISQTVAEANQKIDSESEALKNAQSELQQKIDSLSLEFKEEIAKTNEQGEEISELKKTSYKFDTEDLTIKKSGSELSTKINEDGMRVYKNDEEMLKANNEGVDAVNLHAKTYLIVGNNSRFEDYENENGESRTACFWVGK